MSLCSRAAMWYVICLIHYSAEILVPTLGWGNKECIQNLMGEILRKWTFGI